MQKFQYTIVNSFIDSEAGLVLSMAHFSLSIKQQKQAVYNSITTTKCIKYGMCWTNCLHVCPETLANKSLTW